MRVCAISPHLPPEQAGNALFPVLLATTLAPEGVTTHFVSHPPADARWSAEVAHVTYAPRRGRRRFDRTLAGALLAAARIGMAARGPIAESDLVHLHSNGLLIEVGGWLAERYRRPYVVTLHGSDIWHYDSARHARFARLVRHASYRVFVSEGLRAHARSYGLAPEPSTVILPPVDDTFRPPTPDERERWRAELGVDGPLLLTVKRLHPVAGHAFLLQALPAVLRRYPQATLMLVGTGELRPALEAEASRLGVASAVRFLGSVKNQEVGKYYAAADLFVLPSTLEALPTVLLEALASGTPIVATDTAGGTEVQAHFPADVRLARKADPADLADAICEALGTPTRASESARRTVTAFRPDRCAADYLTVYRALT